MQSAKCRMQSELAERLLSFAVRVGKAVNALPATRLGRHVAGQLIRSGTSAGPNYEEGCAAESRADFLHKLSICLKELRESRFWIRLIVKSEPAFGSEVGRLGGRMHPVVQDHGRARWSLRRRTRRRGKQSRAGEARHNLHFAICIFHFALFDVAPFARKTRVFRWLRSVRNRNR